MMKKTFLFLSVMTLILLLLGFSGVEAGQGSRTPPRIGILIPEYGASESLSIKGLRDGLKELGYKEGENILIEMRDAKGDRGALKPAAMELVKQKVSLIFTTGTRATKAAKAATSKIPIVFRHPGDPVALDLVKSMTRPGGNATGVAGLSLQMTEKRLEILREIVPQLRRVLIFYDSNNPVSRESSVFTQKTAAKLGLEVAVHPTKSVTELKNSISGIQKREGDALFHVADELVESQADFIFETARQKQLPTMFNMDFWATRGSLAGYGPNLYQMGRQSASLVNKILRGQKPGDLPIERANKFDLAINLRTASIIGVAVPPQTVKKADRVIR